MSTQYNGLPSNVAAVIIAPAVAIVSSTATTPLQITATSHGMMTGDYCDVYGHQANSPANGMWPVTVIDANNFTIPTTGISAGGATGSVQPLKDGATYPVPSDGDNENGASVDVALQALGDRTAHVFLSSSAWKLVTRVEQYVTAASTGSFSNAVWAKGTDGTGGAATLMTNNIGGSLAWLTVPAIIPGDIIRVNMGTTAALLSGSGAYVEIWADIPAPGTIASFQKITGCSRSLGSGGGALFGSQVPMHLSGHIASGQAGTFTMELMMAGFSGGAQVTLTGDMELTVEVYRATGVPQ